jgi:hypothetical protein
MVMIYTLYSLRALVRPCVRMYEVRVEVVRDLGSFVGDWIHFWWI